MNSDTLVGSSSPFQELKYDKTEKLSPAQSPLAIKGVKKTFLFKQPSLSSAKAKQARRKLVLKSLKSHSTLTTTTGLCNFDASYFKLEVRSHLNPILRSSHNIVLAAPMEWYDYFTGSKTIPGIPASTIESMKKDIEAYIFPHLKLYQTIVTVEASRIQTVPKALSLWIKFFCLPEKFQHPPTTAYFKHENKLDHFRALLFSLLNASNISHIPFLLIISYAPISLRKVRTVHDKIKEKLNERKESENPQQPLFTLHLQDLNNPYLLLWLDDENISTFNVQQLKSPSSRANFSLTIFQFLAYAQMNSKVKAHS